MKQDIRIEPKADHESYMVNGKEVYKDSQGNYVARHIMSTQENAAFNRYKRMVIDNANFKTHTKATFKI